MSDELARYNTDCVIGGAIKGRFTQLKVLEPGQTYDVPLYVAYHCKLHVAPTQNGSVSIVILLLFLKRLLAEFFCSSFT